MKLTMTLTYDKEEEDGEVCPVCWCDPPKYGISTDCTHFFCEQCIQGHLRNVLNTGKFPGYCPICQSEAPEGQVPLFGRITGKAMTFLQVQYFAYYICTHLLVTYIVRFPSLPFQRHEVINKEFQFRFMRKQDEEQQLFFKCPAKCGNFLVDIDPTYVMDGARVKAQVERCPCGAAVCVQVK